MPFQLTERESLGIREMDEQHKVISAIINELYGSINSLTLEKNLPHIFKKIIGYANFHFGTEEGYFDLFNYEYKDEHIAEHRKIADKVAELEKKYESSGGDVAIAGELADLLENWIIDHISNHDQKYVRCFQEHGLK